VLRVREGLVRISVQFPMKTESENVLRSLPFAVAAAPRGKQMGITISIARSVARQRAEVRRFLDSQLPRLRRDLGCGMCDRNIDHRLCGATRNFFRVTLIRISAGTLDTGNLWSALKNVQDEVAAWLGIDDSARSPASWRVAQQKGPTKTYAVRIEIEDDDPDQREVHRIVGPTIARLGPVVGDKTEMTKLNEAYRREVMMDEPLPSWDGASGFGRATATRHGGLVAQVARGLGLTEKALRTLAPIKCRYLDRSDRRAAEQAPLVFRKAYFVAAEDGDDITLEELTGSIFEALTPPPRIRKSGRVLVRRLDDHPALGEHWIYEAAPSAARQGDARR
jgi:hypothetical protein